MANSSSPVTAADNGANDRSYVLGCNRVGSLCGW